MKIHTLRAELDHVDGRTDMTKLFVALRKLAKSLNKSYSTILNPLNAKLNPICHLLALLVAHHILHVSRIRVKDLY